MSTLLLLVFLSSAYMSATSWRLRWIRSTLAGTSPPNAASSVGEPGVMPIRWSIGSFMPGDAQAHNALAAEVFKRVGILSTAGNRLFARLAIAPPRAAQ